MTRRPTKDEWLMSLAEATALRTTCIRAGVGCVLADSRGQVLSTGYNGPPRGLPHCNERVVIAEWPKSDGAAGFDQRDTFPHVCPGADAKSNPDGCEAVHAEINALLQCRDASEVLTCYVTTEPCFRCAKALMNTGCERVLFLRHNGDGGAAARLWAKGRSAHEWLLVEKRTEIC